jgi:hypothetical protein
VNCITVERDFAAVTSRHQPQSFSWGEPEGELMKAIRMILLGCLAAAAIWAADVTGKWTADMQGPNGNTMTITMNLKADGDRVTGTVSGRRGETDISDGKIDGNDLSFKVVREFNGNQITQKYKGKLDGDTIHFTVTMEGGGGNWGGGQGRQFDAHRASGM